MERTENHKEKKKEKHKEKKYKKKRPGGIFRAFAAGLLIILLLAITGCGRQSLPENALEEGLSYLKKEAGKDPAEILQMIRSESAAAEEKTADGSSEKEETSEKGSGPEEPSGTEETTNGRESSGTEGTEGASNTEETTEGEGSLHSAGTEGDTHTEDNTAETAQPGPTATAVSETGPSEAVSQDPPAELLAQIDALQIAMFSEAELAEYRNRFMNTVFVGDSLTQAMLTYGFFDENHIKFKRSASISQLGEEIDAALAMLPDNLVFFTGLNDVSFYIADPYQYGEAYKAAIAHVRSKSPGTRVIVISLLPPSDYLAAVNLNLARSPEFDAQLRRAAEETGIPYIDCHWMVRQQLYLDDGIHFKDGFYTVLIRYLAYRLGL